MGMCLSRCGEVQHKAAVVAVSMSQQSASPARASLAEVQEPRQSLKRFLHLYSDGTESGKRFFLASLRPSLEESFAIPHSSELFSLPSEGMESDRSRSPSPSRGSISSSVCRSSTSSRALASPRGRYSGGVRPGRFSADRPPIAPRGSARKVPARKSCSSVGQTVHSPHKNLVETIARLEKFCDVKLFLEKRSNSLLRQSSSPELSKSAGQENSVLLHDSCRDLAQKLLCFANEHAYQHSHDSQAHDVLCGSMRRCDSSAKDLIDSAAQLKDGLLLEKSVETFLKEVEDFVSKVDAAPQNLTDQFTEERRVEGVSRLPILQFQDADDKIQFTDFEATFELCPDVTNMTMSDPRLGADGHTFCNVATEDILGPGQARALVSAECETENVEPLSPKLAHRHCKATSDLVGTHDIASSPKDSQQEKKVPKNPVLRSVLTDISFNVTPAHDIPVRKNHPLKFRTSNGSKRGVSRSLDLQDRSICQLEFNSFRRERWDLAQETCDSMQDDGSTLNSAETQKSQVTETTYNQRKADGEACTREDNAVSQSADVASSQSQPTQKEVPADGEERIQHAHLQGTESGHLDHDSTENDSLAMAFDNLLKLLQSPPGELAQSTSELLELLAAKTEISADETHASDPDQAEAHMPASFEAESWHDAPASLSSTPELHSPRSP